MKFILLKTQLTKIEKRIFGFLINLY